MTISAQEIAHYVATLPVYVDTRKTKAIAMKTGDQIIVLRIRDGGESRLFTWGHIGEKTCSANK